jgi:hypothetical protein
MALVSLLLACGSVRAAADPQAAPAPACDPQASDRPGYCSYPADVRDFIDMRDGCDHWRGEPIPGPEDDHDQDRRKQILAGIEESCTGTDKRLATLKATYAKDPRILELLDEYEPDIETDG